MLTNLFGGAAFGATGDARALSQSEMQERMIAQLHLSRNCDPPHNWEYLRNYRPRSSLGPPPAGWVNWFAIGDELA